MSTDENEYGRDEPVERVVTAWLAETERHDRAAAQEARAGWADGSLSDRAAEDLATWVTARGPSSSLKPVSVTRADGPVRITPADKETVHRWLRDHGHRV
jgi:hypothetical protein